MSQGQASEPHTSVRFTTKLEPRWVVSDTPLDLPTRLSRYGLSEVVNHLLGASPARPFDFLLDGELLRGSLGKALAARGLSGESTITLEYIELLAPPQPRGEALVPDWISSLALAAPGSSVASSNPVLSGCYDGAAYLWDASGVQAAALGGGEGAAAVKAVAWLGERPVVASKDGAVRVWAAGGSAGGAAQLSCVGHHAAVACLAAAPAADSLATGGWDRSILLFRPPADGVPAASSEPPPSKRARGGASAVTAAVAPEELAAAAQLCGHTDCVSALAWPTAALLYSASWDGTVREWDAAVGAATATLSSSGKAALCLDVSLSPATVATGHSDHQLRLWDARSRGGAPTGAISHHGWVSSVAWCGVREHLLVSGCHDGGVRLWDTRSPRVALHSLPRHKGKALCVAWDGADAVVSGGTDGQLRISTLAA